MPSRHQIDTSTRFSAAALEPPEKEIENAALDPIPSEDPQTVTIGREPYIAGKDLEDAVNVAIALGRPLLLQGDPGAGKTRLAHAVAFALGVPLEEAYVKSTSRAQDLLYTYDAIRRLYDAQIPKAAPTQDKMSPDRYVRLGPLGRAIERAMYRRRSVVLIDEIDKADIDFPNDLLHELDRLTFDVPEVPGLRYAVPDYKPELRPVVIVTNNEEKALPAAFLRRCVFHYIEFPASLPQLDRILALHAIDDAALREDALSVLLRLRRLDLAKKPGLSELLDWVSYLKATETAPRERGSIPYLGALVKQHDDQRRVQEDLTPR